MSPFISFYRNRDGGVGLMFGFVGLLIAAAAGGALDYSNAVKERTTLQDMADASAIVAARLGKDQSLAEYEKAAQNFFMNTATCAGIACTPPVVSMGENGAVRVEAVVDVPTYILDIVGIGSVPIAVAAEALPPDDFGVDVVMVLDYSGSMGWDGKYTSMANAAKDFIDRSEARKGDTMRVGVVPFSEYVLTPMKGQFAYDIAGAAALTGIDIVGCALNREYPHSVNADTPNSVVIGSLWPISSYTTGSAEAASSYSDAFSGAVQTAATDWTSDGVVMDYRYEYYDLYPSMSPNTEPTITDTGVGGIEVDGHNRFAFRWLNPPASYMIINYHAWSNVPTTFFNGYGDSAGWDMTADGSLPSDFDAHQLAEALDGSCGAYAEKSLWARPLSTEFEKLKEAIDEMEPLGQTNIALGLDLGWHYLTGNEPFDEAAPEPDTVRALVLLSDGTQTVAAHGAGGIYNVDSANANITETCGAAKASGIDIYTIAFGINDPATRTLVEGCSSGGGFYFEPNDGAELEEVFDDIFDAISPSKTRISM